MKRTLFLIPFLGLTAFGGYYHHWTAEQTARIETIARDPLTIYNHRDGRADAAADLARGKLRLLLHGIAPADLREYRGLLEHVYRVRLELVTEDPTIEVKRYVAAYNEIMERHIATIFGPDTLAETRVLAQRRHALAERIAAYVSPL